MIVDVASFYGNYITIFQHCVGGYGGITDAPAAYVPFCWGVSLGYCHDCLSFVKS